MDTENNEEDEWEVVKRKKRAVPMDSDAMSVASTVRSSNSSKKLESWEKNPLPGFYVPREKSVSYLLISFLITFYVNSWQFLCQFFLCQLFYGNFYVNSWLLCSS